MTRRPKTPRKPPGPLSRQGRDVAAVSGVLWRVHRTAGPHVLPWDRLRAYGPVPTMRYDPHPEPAGDHPGHGVCYAALDLATSLAEAFQAARLVDTSAGAPHATAWAPARPLALLDLTDTWPIRNGAAAALASADRAVCRSWARAIHAAWPDLDGLLSTSTWTGRRTATLWGRAADSFPPRPAFSRPLAHPLVWSLARAAADDIGYGLV